MAVNTFDGINPNKMTFLNDLKALLKAKGCNAYIYDHGNKTRLITEECEAFPVLIFTHDQETKTTEVKTRPLSILVTIYSDEPNTLLNKLDKFGNFKNNRLKFYP